MKSKYVTTTAIVHSAIDARLWNVELPNGKMILGHVPKNNPSQLEAGAEIKVKLNVADFSHGEIVQ